MLDADEGAHPAADANLMAVAEQVFTENVLVAERGLRAGGGNIHKLVFDLHGGQVQDGDVVGVRGGEGGKAQGGHEQGGKEDDRPPASRHGNLSRRWASSSVP